MSRLAPEVLDQYRQHAAAGRTQSQTAKLMGVSRERVRQIAGKHSIAFPRAHRTREEIDRSWREIRAARQARQEAIHAARQARRASLPPHPFIAPFRVARVCVCGELGFVGLTRGLVAFCDPEDVAKIGAHRWQALPRGRTAYAVSGRAGGGNMRMSRLLLEEPDSRVDHASGDGLDNRKANLRACTAAENNFNKRRMGNSTVPFKGIGRGKGTKFRAAIKVRGVRIHLGCHETAEDAARAYDEAARQFHGAFARTNVDLGLLPTLEARA